MPSNEVSTKVLDFSQTLSFCTEKWNHSLLSSLEILSIFESVPVLLFYLCVFVFVCVYSSLIISKCPRLPLIVNISAWSKPQLPNWTFQQHTRPKISNSWRWHPEKILVCTLISLGRDKIKVTLMCAPAKILNWPPLPLIILPLTAKASQIYSIFNQLSIAKKKQTLFAQAWPHAAPPFLLPRLPPAISSQISLLQKILVFLLEGYPPPWLIICLPKNLAELGGTPFPEWKIGKNTNEG